PGGAARARRSRSASARDLAFAWVARASRRARARASRAAVDGVSRAPFWPQARGATRRAPTRRRDVGRAPSFTSAASRALARGVEQGEAVTRQSLSAPETFA